MYENIVCASNEVIFKCENWVFSFANRQKSSILGVLSNFGRLVTGSLEPKHRKCGAIIPFGGGFTPPHPFFFFFFFFFFAPYHTHIWHNILYFSVNVFLKCRQIKIILSWSTRPKIVRTDNFKVLHLSGICNYAKQNTHDKLMSTLLRKCDARSTPPKIIRNFNKYASKY